MILEPGLLLRGQDPLKNQSYFLSKLNETQLKNSVFPVGALTKSIVKNIAKKAGFFSIASKKEVKF